MSSHPKVVVQEKPKCTGCRRPVDTTRCGWNDRGIFCEACWYCPDCGFHNCRCFDEEDEA